MPRYLAVAVSFTAATATACATSTRAVKNIGGAPDYSVSFVSADPEPGSVLTPGQTASIAVTVKYSLQARATGRVLLIFENEANRLVESTRHQASQEVARGSGEITVSDSLTLPPDIRELHVFVPLVTHGMLRTSGELMITYPVKQSR